MVCALKDLNFSLFFKHPVLTLSNVFEMKFPGYYFKIEKSIENMTLQENI